MLSIDVQAKPKQTNITENITRKWRLKRHQFINHNQNHKPRIPQLTIFLSPVVKKCYLNNYREKRRRCTLNAVCSVLLILTLK